MGTSAPQARRDPLTVGCVALLTDFGLEDPYVGQMKGVLLAKGVRVPVVDLAHGLPAQDIRAGAFVLAASAPHFPEGTLFVCVVDPGVGTARKIVWARDAKRSYLAPDNGVLSRLELLEARVVENKKLFLPNPSATFHGRDVFAPVAAALAGGLPPEELGASIDVPAAFAEKPPEGFLGSVVFLDRFGNAVTDIPAAQVPRGAEVEVEGTNFGALRTTYGEVGVGEALALIGSFGTVEFALREGDAAERFAIRPGDLVRIVTDREPLM